MTTRIKLRRDTAANWTSNDPVLALGEAGYDTTNNELRVGDGTTVWSGLEAIGGTSNKITAEETYSANHSDGSDQTFTYTTGSIAVQMGNNIGLYLNDLLSRWVEYFDGALQFPYNYSDVSLVINPGTTNLSTTVTNVVSDNNDPPLYTITLATTDSGPITITDIGFNYNYINTIGLDTVNNFFGMATGDDDIDIRSGRDITLDAADDFRVTAGNVLKFTLKNLDDMSSDEGVEIRTETTSSNYSWIFRLDGNLELPEGLTLPYKNNTGYQIGYGLNGPTLQLSNDNNNQVIVTGPTPTANNPYAQRIVIQGQRGYGSTSTQGEGGDVYIWGGIGGEFNGNTDGWSYGGGSGGDVKLRGGEGINNEGGYVKIEGGNVAHFNTATTGNAGFVEITGGDVIVENAAGSSYGGDIRITGGRAFTATTQSGVVQVITGGYANGNVVGDKIWTFGGDGSLSLPGSLQFPNNYSIGQGEGSLAILSPDSVVIVADQGNTDQLWLFGTDGALQYPHNVVQQPTDTVTCAGNTSTVVYTASGQYRHTIKLLIQVEGFVGAAGDFDTQACEMIIVKSGGANNIAASVYAVIHTSVAPLATFSAQWNALTNRVQVLCATPSANSVDVRMFATEITSSD
jgi:hypothetical protein